MKPLPANPDARRHLLEAAERALVVLEPIHQQAKEVTRYASDLRDGRANDRSYYVQVMVSLTAKLANGLPVSRLIRDYMPTDVFVVNSAPPCSELDRLEQRIWHDTATDEERCRHIEITCQMIPRFSLGIERYVDEVLELQRRIIAGLGVDPMPVDPPTNPAVQAPEKPANPPTQRAARARSKNVTSLGMLGLGLDERNRWVAFDRHGSVWQRRGLIENQPKAGRVTVLLKAFLDAGGSQESDKLVRLVSPAVSTGQAKKHSDTRLKPSLSKVRAWLREVFELGEKSDPIQLFKNPPTYRMMITVGHVMSDDDDKPQFVPVVKEG